jgi:syntaxin 1B/2/3
MLASQNARSALEDVQEKHKDIQRLESSIQELHQLFVDLSVLVESQGELLNDIEHNVGTSVEYMKSGVGELVKANDYAAKSRKKMCCLIMFFVIVAAVTVLPNLL